MKNLYTVGLLLSTPSSVLCSLVGDLQILQQNLNDLSTLVVPVSAQQGRIPKVIEPPYLDSEQLAFINEVIKKVPMRQEDKEKLNKLAEHVANKIIDQWDARYRVESDGIQAVINSAIVADIEKPFSVDELEQIFKPLPRHFGSNAALIQTFRSSITNLRDTIRKLLEPRLEFLYAAKDDFDSMDDRIKAGINSVKSEENLIGLVIKCMSVRNFTQSRQDDFKYFFGKYDDKIIASDQIREMLQKMSKKISDAWKARAATIQEESEKGLTDKRRESIEFMVRKMRTDIGGSQALSPFFTEKPTEYGGYSTPHAVYKWVLEQIQPRLSKELESEMLKSNPAFGTVDPGLSKKDVELLKRFRQTIEELIEAAKKEMRSLGV